MPVIISQQVVDFERGGVITHIQDDPSGPSPSGIILIDEICAEFEQKWHTNDPPEISQYIDRVRDDLQPYLIQTLIVVDQKYRTGSDNPSDTDENLSFFEGPTVISDQSQEPDDSRVDFGDSSTVPSHLHDRVFGDYEMKELIGRGGMGHVYKARQISLNRWVAVKILPGGRFASQEAIDRFSVEASAIAALEHPNIVPVYHVGEHFGSHYLAMKLIDGQSFAKQIQKKGPFDPRDAAELIRKLAIAIEFAHQNEIIHRDLKPANVLLDRDGNPWIVDFGLAKKLNDDSNMTRSGLLIGTPAYVAPELADNGSDATKAVDIYGLGAVFYTALTGNPPHSAHSILEIIRQVVHVSPVRPRDINPSVPIELETICLKCLSKSPFERYAKAQGVADDLERFLEGRPIHAKRESYWRQGWKHVRRNRIPIAIMVAILAFAGLAASGWWQARTHLREAKISEAVSLISVKQTGRRFGALSAISEAAAIERSLELRDLSISAMANVDLRVSKLIQADLQNTSALDGAFKRYANSNTAGRIEIRSVATDEIQIVIPETGRRSQRLEFSADGRYLAAAYHRRDDDPEGDELFRVWNLETGEPLKSVPESANGNDWAIDNARRTIVVVDKHGVINFCHLDNDEVTKTLPPGSWIRNISISADGTLLAVSRIDPNRVEIIDSNTGDRIKTLPHDDVIRAIEWKPNNNQLATTNGRSVVLWNVNTAEQIWSANGHDVAAASLAFSPNGQLVASADWDGKVCLWRSCDGELILSAPGRLWIRFSEDGSRLAGAAVNEHVGIWDVSLAPESSVITTGQLPGPQSVAFSKCSRVLATSGIAGIRLWRSHNLVDPKLIVSYANYDNVRFTDSEMMASTGSEIHIWPIQIDDEKIEVGNPVTLVNGDSLGKTIATDATGKFVATLAPEEGRVLLRRFDSPAEATAFSDNGPAGSVALSDNGKWLATGTINQRLRTRIWNTETKELAREIDSGDAHVRFTPDNRFLVIGSESTYDFLDLDSFATHLSIKRIAKLRGPVACCTRGSLVALTETHNAVSLFNWRTGKRIARLRNPTPGSVCDLDFSSDGKYLAVATESRKVHVWNLSELRAGLVELRLDWRDDHSGD